VVDVEPAFVSDRESAEAINPSKAALDDPSVATEYLAGLDASPCYAGLDLTAKTGVLATTMVVSLVSVQLLWSSAGGPSLSAG
jgi:hypothetical protein